MKRTGQSLRSAVPLVLMLISVATIAVAAVQAWRLARSNQEQARRVLMDYAGIATWNYSRFASAALEEAVIAVLHPVMHYQRHGARHRGNPVHPSWFVDHYLDTLSVHFGDQDSVPTYRPSTFLGFTLGADTLAQAGAPVDAALLEGLTDTLNHHIRATYEPAWGWGLLSRRVAGGTQMVAWTIMPLESSDSVPGDTAVYAFVAEPGLWLPLLEKTYREAPILPPELTRGLPNQEVLAVSLRTQTDDKLFLSHERPFTSSGPLLEQELPRRFGGLRVASTIRPEVALTLIIGGVPQSRVPGLLGLLAIAVVLSLFAFQQMRREQELARLRADFVSSVSHELRTPLAQIRLFLETLRLGRVRTPDQVEWSLDNIDRETARLGALIERILTFSRASRDELTPRPEPTDLSAAVADIATSFAPLAKTRDARIEIDAAAGVSALVDRDMFRQVLLNLLDNAVKYGAAGQVVRVGVHRSGELVRITVQDEGPGVDAAEREEIFRPFHRGREGVRSGTGGGGIGLSIVHSIIEQHGGRVRVENAPGGGARFVIELPAGWTAAPGGERAGPLPAAAH